MYKPLVQIITEKLGAAFWVQDGFHYRHTSSAPMNHSPALCVPSALPYSTESSANE